VWSVDCYGQIAKRAMRAADVFEMNVRMTYLAWQDFIAPKI
jgi:hypothetical protein